MCVGECLRNIKTRHALNAMQSHRHIDHDHLAAVCRVPIVIVIFICVSSSFQWLVHGSDANGNFAICAPESDFIPFNVKTFHHFPFS